MKKIIIILVVIALFGVGAYYFFLETFNTKPIRCEEGFRFDPSVQQCVSVIIPVEEKKVDFSTVDVQIPETLIKVKLEKGAQDVYSATYTNSELSATQGFISIDASQIVDFSENLLLVPMIVNSGGTGQFSYVALFDKKENKHLSSIFIGDRISVGTIEVEKEIAKVNFKTRATSQSYGDQPSIPAQIVLNIKNSEMKQIMKLHNSDYNQIEIKTPFPNSSVSGDFTVKGSVPGFWYFEAIAQFKILDASYNEIAIGTVPALSDWMTEQRVPFEVKLNTGNFIYKGAATIVIESENVQGDLEGELQVKRLEIPFVIK